MAPTIEELDATVRAFYEGRGDTQKAAQATLNQFKEDPDAWLLLTNCRPWLASTRQCHHDPVEGPSKRAVPR
ncbi:hypothetical protein OIDMADRAFT_112682 [Oidiodendron maius Zn]|uniref:Uncharacterized protein n=1 Tax=Oidiodendron maius (strain Zn) TaxID=913774 RepID=A0A0C3HBM7_OIDMZ|nr:hypothetical protein OIDMADRAFT_112682 [Oidiodendron maius Zn]